MGWPRRAGAVASDALSGDAPRHRTGETRREARCLRPLSPSGAVTWFWPLGPIGAVVLTDGTLTAPFRSPYQAPSRFEGEIGGKKAVLERVEWGGGSKIAALSSRTKIHQRTDKRD
jgi:hypothetical protein